MMGGDDADRGKAKDNGSTPSRGKRFQGERTSLHSWINCDFLSYK